MGQLCAALTWPAQMNFSFFFLFASSCHAIVALFSLLKEEKNSNTVTVDVCVHKVKRSDYYANTAVECMHV